MTAGAPRLSVAPPVEEFTGIDAEEQRAAVVAAASLVGQGCRGGGGGGSGGGESWSTIAAAGDTAGARWTIAITPTAPENTCSDFCLLSDVAAAFDTPAS